MKKLLIIKGIFNDEFTGYVDKESSVSMIVDTEEDCNCTPIRKCGICNYIDEYGLVDIPENYNK